MEQTPVETLQPPQRTEMTPKSLASEACGGSLNTWLWPHLLPHSTPAMFLFSHAYQACPHLRPFAHAVFSAWNTLPPFRTWLAPSPPSFLSSKVTSSGKPFVMTLKHSLLQLISVVSLTSPSFIFFNSYHYLDLPYLFMLFITSGLTPSTPLLTCTRKEACERRAALSFCLSLSPQHLAQSRHSAYVDIC